MVEVQAAIRFALGFNDNAWEPERSMPVHELAAEWLLDEVQ